MPTKKPVSKKRISKVKEEPEEIDLPIFEVVEEARKSSMNLTLLRWILVIATIGLFLIGWPYIIFGILSGISTIALLVFEEQIKSLFE